MKDIIRDVAISMFFFILAREVVGADMAASLVLFALVFAFRTFIAWSGHVELFSPRK